jgi:hypothetical protein
VPDCKNVENFQPVWAAMGHITAVSTPFIFYSNDAQLCLFSDAVGWPGTLWTPNDLPVHLELERNDLPPTLPSIFEFGTDDIVNRVKSIVVTFCPNLNCVESMCWGHCMCFVILQGVLDSFVCIDPQHLMFDLDKIESKVKSESMKISNGSPCGEECFRYFHDEAFMVCADFLFVGILCRDNISKTLVQWENECDADNLASHLKIFPDLLPCEVSVLIRKPCREVFAIGCSILLASMSVWL